MYSIIEEEIIDTNTKCYTMETLILGKKGDGLFDNSIDMCYVLTMKNSERIPKFMKQLKEHIPLSTIIIQYNEGYKKCNKILKNKKSLYD